MNTSTRVARVVPPHEGTTLPMFGLLKASVDDSDAGFEILEYRGPLQPPPHRHHDRDEVFYILEGTFTFTLARDEIEASTGTLVVIPRGTRHGFRTNDDGRALLFITPGGLEGFFDELGHGVQAGKTSAELRAALAGRYDSHPDDDIEVTGPPITEADAQQVAAPLR